MKWAAVFAAGMTLSSTASGQTLKLMDLKDVDPVMLKDIYGAWEVQDARARSAAASC
jgi:hypothetical protein